MVHRAKVALHARGFVRTRLTAGATNTRDLVHIAPCPQIYVIEFDEEELQLRSAAFRHPRGEVWGITASPAHSDVLATIYNHGVRVRVRVRVHVHVYVRVSVASTNAHIFPALSKPFTSCSSSS